MKLQRVLITGCSTGIGRALAADLSKRGHQVIATARNPASLADLNVAQRLALDVTSDTSVADLVRQIGAVDVLVNNAGVGLWGPLEAITVDQLRHAFDTNVIGVHRVTRAFLPLMRRQRRGHIVQISSAAGRQVSPLVGGYAASKHALEAMSEALRVELAPFGIKVSIVELGAVDSAFGTNRTVVEDADYAPIITHFRNRIMASRANPTSSEDVASAVADIIESNAPRLRYEATADATTIIARRKSLTDEDWEAGLLNGLKMT